MLLVGLSAEGEGCDEGGEFLPGHFTEEELATRVVLVDET